MSAGEASSMCRAAPKLVADLLRGCVPLDHNLYLKHVVQSHTANPNLSHPLPIYLISGETRPPQNVHTIGTRLGGCHLATSVACKWVVVMVVVVCPSIRLALCNYTCQSITHKFNLTSGWHNDVRTVALYSTVLLCRCSVYPL